MPMRRQTSGSARLLQRVYVESELGDLPRIRRSMDALAEDRARVLDAPDVVRLGVVGIALPPVHPQGDEVAGRQLVALQYAQRRRRAVGEVLGERSRRNTE